MQHVDEKHHSIEFVKTNFYCNSWKMNFFRFFNDSAKTEKTSKNWNRRFQFLA